VSIPCLRSSDEGGLGSDALKPDGLGVHGNLREDPASWRNIEVAIEVKDDWNELITQAAIYASWLFAARESRLFALMIALNHKTSAFRFCFFRRDGLWASPALDLRKAEGFRMFARAIVVILSWKTLSDAGMDPVRSDRYFLIANRCLKIVEVICNRTSVRGRATRVYAIETRPTPTTDDNTSTPLPKHSEIRACPRPRTQPPSARNANSAPRPPSASRSSSLPSLIERAKI
jgi:hypothetical protein